MKLNFVALFSFASTVLCKQWYTSTLFPAISSKVTIDRMVFNPPLSPSDTLSKCSTQCSRQASCDGFEVVFKCADPEICKNTWYLIIYWTNECGMFGKGMVEVSQLLSKGEGGVYFRFQPRIGIVAAVTDEVEPGTISETTEKSLGPLPGTAGGQVAPGEQTSPGTAGGLIPGGQVIPEGNVTPGTVDGHGTPLENIQRARNGLEELLR